MKSDVASPKSSSFLCLFHLLQAPCFPRLVALFLHSKMKQRSIFKSLSLWPWLLLSILLLSPCFVITLPSLPLVLLPLSYKDSSDSTEDTEHQRISPSRDPNQLLLQSPFNVSSNVFQVLRNQSWLLWGGGHCSAYRRWYMNYLDTILDNLSIGESSFGGTGQMRGWLGGRKPCMDLRSSCGAESPEEVSHW